MKNRVKKKSKSSWLCFRPRTLDEEEEDDFEPRSIDSPVYIAVKPQSPEKKFPKEIIPTPDKSSPNSRRRALSGVFKTVLFETVLIKSRKVQQDPYHTLKNIQELRSTNNNKPSKQDDVISLKNLSKNRKVPVQQVKKPSKEEDREKRSSKIPATTTIISTSSSASNLAALGDNKVSENPKHSKAKKFTSNSSLNGLLLLMISLIMLVFWGRVCAIICTSTWIYFGPSFNHIKEEEEVVGREITRKAGEVQEMESRQYKKRVIMEGLLGRTHSRV